MASVPEGVLLGLGNPLLDITITEDESFLKKYGLEANNAIEADDSHLTMFDDIINHHKPTYIAGKCLCPSVDQTAETSLQKRHSCFRVNVKCSFVNPRSVLCVGSVSQLKKKNVL